MQPNLSVIICAHNPRLDYLEKVLQALKDQTLSVETWELLLIDNASDKLLSLEIDLTWHPQSRHIREEKLGLTSARLRGINEAIAETLVFVDDDNVLKTDYLEISLHISKAYPFLGAWGGQALPGFEESPPEWTKPFWYLLAIREFDRDQWSNLYEAGTDPHGAGMCIRKIVAERYANLVMNSPERTRLGRKGQALLCCEDTDMAFTSCDLGLGMGLFVTLKLTHLIPGRRLQEDYLLRLAETSIYSVTIQRSFRSPVCTPFKVSWFWRLFELYSLWRMPRRQRMFLLAERRGRDRAIQELLSTKTT
jgi:glycosyltransferase involved in cell wall biosynthesis